MATIQSTGVGSGLDVTAIVTQLMALERRPLQVLDGKEAAFKAQLSAYGSMKSVLAGLRTAAAALGDPAKLRAVKTSVADTTLASATASAGAAAGVYELEVQKLAQQQKIRSAGFAAGTSPVGTGTLTISFGTYSGGAFAANTAKPDVTVNIGPGQNTLAGVRDAINAAGAGVGATIVNDGSNARLVITSTDTGAANALRIDVADGDGNNTDAAGLSQLAYDASTGGVMRLTETAVAQDAVALIDGITVTSATNTLSSALEGVSLQLAKAAPGTKTTLTVARDIDGAKASVEAFVKAYNDAAKALKTLSAYDANTKTAGPLQGDSTLLGAQSRLRATMTTALQFSGGYASLSELGIGFQRDGTLTSDATRLRAALADTSRDAASAFAAIGTPTDSLVRFVADTSAAVDGDYTLNVTQLATRGQAAGGAPAVLTIAAGVNDTLQITVDGTLQTVTLTAGSYTADTLAAHLQAKAAGVEVSAAGGVLTVTSKSWGSASTVAVTGGNAAADLFGGATSTGGVNAAGTINGFAAVGAGRNLTAKGITVAIEGGATGARGTVRYSRGVADRIDTLIGDIVDGQLTARTTGIGTSITGIGTQRLRVESRLESVEKRLRAQFTALDHMVASMNKTSTFLTQQLANLPKSGS